ncbi:hypothetical protein ACW9YQ_17820 (plasmid) [Paraburkholderia strydomiana]
MAKHRKEQGHKVGLEDDTDRQPVNAPATSDGSDASGSAAPILQSEDDELFDEDAPE